MSIINWTDYFLEVAKTAAMRSNCLRSQVGAVIVSPDKMIKATGYNGTPSKVTSCYERNFCYRIKNDIPSGTKYETCRNNVYMGAQFYMHIMQKIYSSGRYKRCLSEKRRKRRACSCICFRT